jgi:toxin CcdB
VPVLEVEGIECVVETPKLAAVPTRALKTPVGSLAASQTEITQAQDFLVHGF